MSNRDYAASAYLLNNILGSLSMSFGHHSVSSIVCGDEGDDGLRYMLTQLYSRNKESVSSLSASNQLGHLPKLVVLTQKDSLAEDLATVLPMLGKDDYLALRLVSDDKPGEDSLRYIESIRNEFKFARARPAYGPDLLLLSRSEALKGHISAGGPSVIGKDSIRAMFPVPAKRNLVGDSSLDRPIRGWFHIACMHGGDLIAAEMHGRLLQSGLLSMASSVEVSMLGDQTGRDRLMANIIGTNPKYKLNISSHDVSLYEWPALIEMWRAARTSDFYAFYVHTKGASNCRPDVPTYIQCNLRNWRHCMSHFVIGEHMSALTALKGGYDTSGALYYPCVNPGIGGMYGGNFWWATSEHLRRLPDPRGLAGSSGEARMRAESWLCSLEDGKYFNQYWSESGDPYDFPGVYQQAGGPLPMEEFL